MSSVKLKPHSAPLGHAAVGYVRSPVVRGGAGYAQSGETYARLAVSPAHNDRGMAHGVLLLICMVLALPALIVDVQTPPMVHPGEVAGFNVSLQSWQHWSRLGQQEGASLMERAIPHADRKPLFDKPPGVVWMHMAAFSMTTGELPTTEGLLVRARLVSVGVAMLAVVSLYWAGVSLGGLLGGLFAAMIVAANGYFVYHARLASPAVHWVAWPVLGIAAGLWAIRPFKPVASWGRQAMGWMVCGVALGVSILANGPASLLLVCLPVLLILMLCPHRTSHAMGLLAAMLIGILMALPWVAYAHSHSPDIWRQWLVIRGAAVGGPGTWLAVGAALLPWSVWLIGAAIHLVGSGDQELRSRLRLGWVWLGCTLVAGLTLFNFSDPGHLLAMLVPLAVLVGQLFGQYVGLREAGRSALSWRVLRWPYAAVVLAASVAVPLGLALQPELVDRGLLVSPLTQPIHWLSAVGMGAALLLTAGLSLKWLIGRHVHRVLVIWVAWHFLLIWMVIIPLARGSIAA